MLPGTMFSCSSGLLPVLKPESILMPSQVARKLASVSQSLLLPATPLTGALGLLFSKLVIKTI